MDTSTLLKTSALIEKQADVFHRDVMRGLSASPKYLESKYFYDDKGDVLFQQIMNCPEYYLTNCELEILAGQTGLITSVFTDHFDEFDLVELGAGDALKSVYLLKELLKSNISFTYFPIDISGHVISQLKEKLPAELPGLNLHGLKGEYFEMLDKAARVSSRNKIVLFLGSNIGNMPPGDAEKFCITLRENLSAGDLALIGFDLKKHPQTILSAYNDPGGITREFNLNLLHRINRELGADFNTSGFEHYATYDPATGGCKSYLISLDDQQVIIKGSEPVYFAENEIISMEISQKYTAEETNCLAEQAGFKPVAYFYDSKRWFLDVLWECI